jgi:peptidyl-dipeptidase A
MRGLAFCSAVALGILGCDADVGVEIGSAAATPTAEESADAFVARVNDELEEMSIELGAAAWVRATYINHDTAILNSLASQKYAEWHSRTVADSLRYADMQLAPRTARALNLLKLGDVPASA